MIQSFEIPGRLPGKNEYTNACRKNRYAGAKMKRDAQNLVGWAIRKANLKPMSGLVDVHFNWIEPNKRRDKDNIRGADKFILDALVELAIIKDDGWRYVNDFSDSYDVDKENPRIVVTLEEISTKDINQ